MILPPTKNDLNPKGSYLLSGKKLANMLTPAEWIDGVKGEIAITEQPDGSISIGWDSSVFAYVIVNGELRACMIPLTFIADPAA